MLIRRVVPRPSATLPWFRRRWIWVCAGIAMALVGFLILRPFWQLTSQFDELIFRQPSRLYARPTVLQAGAGASIARIVEALQAQGYREQETEGTLPAGRYQTAKGRLTVHLRNFQLPDGQRGGGVVEVSTRGGHAVRLRQDGREVDAVTLDPPLLASYYGPDLLERRPVALDEVSEDLIAAVIAAEDANFFRHSGVSFSGMARAFWVNLRGGEIRQGGSTLTQQLVKNLYLTHKRTLVRKSQELLLALLLELRYSKKEILEAYLNEIYLGESGGVNLMGMGAASRAFFGKDASQLDLAEAAMLAGMIRAPGPYSPILHPDHAKERRDFVLRRLAELRRIDPARIEQALAEPLVVSPEPLVRRGAPYFADAMAQEAARRYSIQDLADGGYVLLSTLDWQDQQAAQRAVTDGVEKIEKGYKRRTPGTSPLQGALVSVDARTGGILAYVGGRSWQGSQFDRAGQALRQAGSAFKPVVYAAAFEGGFFLPSSQVEDTPFTWNMAGQDWSPKNDDGSFHGVVTVRTALEHSYNPATARIAKTVGIERIMALAERMGIPSRRQPFPSLALGASEVTPVELATAYATLAAGGVRPPVHGLAAVLDRYGKPVAGETLPAPQRVISAQTAYMVTSLMQGVLAHGTAGGAANSDFFAGKTGTTNKQRDSWFGGISPVRATVVWVGYDDNASTRLSGARAALPIWVRFIVQVAPRDGYRTFRQPKGLTLAYIDPTTGKLATEYCPVRTMEVFPVDKVPTETCDQHSWYDESQVADTGGLYGPGGDDRGEGEAAPGDETAPRDEATGESGGRDRDHPFRRFFHKIFGSDRSERDKAPPQERNRPPDEGDPPPPP